MFNDIMNYLRTIYVYNEKTKSIIREKIDSVEKFTPDEFVTIYKRLRFSMPDGYKIMINKIDNMTSDCIIKLLLSVEERDQTYIAKNCIDKIDQITADQIITVTGKRFFNFKLKYHLIKILATKMKNVTVDDIIKIALTIDNDSYPDYIRFHVLDMLLKYVGDITSDQIVQIIKLDTHDNIFKILSGHIKSVTTDDIVNFITAYGGRPSSYLIVEFFYEKLDTPTSSDDIFNECVINIVSKIYKDSCKMRIVNIFYNRLVGTLQFVEQLSKYFSNGYKVLLCKLFKIAEIDSIPLMDSKSNIEYYDYVIIDDINYLCKIINNINTNHLKKMVKYFTMKKQDWINLIHNCKKNKNSIVLIDFLVNSIHDTISTVNDVCDILAVLKNNYEKFYFIKRLYEKIKIDDFTSVCNFIPYFAIENEADDMFVVKTALLFKHNLTIVDINKIVSMITDKNSIERLKNIFTSDRVFVVNKSDYDVVVMNDTDKFFCLGNDTLFLVNGYVFYSDLPHNDYNNNDKYELFTIPEIVNTISTSTDKNDKCPICHINSKNIISECEHQFCLKCLLSSFEIFHNKCPKCRCTTRFKLISVNATLNC